MRKKNTTHFCLYCYKQNKVTTTIGMRLSCPRVYLSLTPASHFANSKTMYVQQYTHIIKSVQIIKQSNNSQNLYIVVESFPV